jgi:hypothetical protein
MAILKTVPFNHNFFCLVKVSRCFVCPLNSGYFIVKIDFAIELK